MHASPLSTEVLNTIDLYVLCINCIYSSYRFLIVTGSCSRLAIYIARLIAMHAAFPSFDPGVDLGGLRGPVPPSKNFTYKLLLLAIYSMKISFNDVLSFINVKNYVYN